MGVPGDPSIPRVPKASPPASSGESLHWCNVGLPEAASVELGPGEALSLSVSLGFFYYSITIKIAES